jgi:hypothetical protein
MTVFLIFIESTKEQILAFRAQKSTLTIMVVSVLHCWLSFMLSEAYKPFLLSVVMLNAIMLSIIVLNIIMLSVIMLSVFMLSFIMLNVIILSVIMLNIIMLSVMLKVIILGVNYE